MDKRVVKKLTGIFNIYRYASYIAAGRLNGKVAIVTASTDGIGYGIAERLGREGAKVIISSRKQKNVDQALEKLKSHKLDVCGLVCHVANPEDRKRLYDEAIKQYGGINILVSNAAVNPAIGGVLECDESSWDKIFDVNVKSSFMLAKEAVPHLEKQGSGKIVFISSIAGFQPFPLLGAYSQLKAALHYSKLCSPGNRKNQICTSFNSK
ncbi:short chain dehydrogenase [Popillia japonica]|uniref:Short chain dehydrogenase n=1 Tax=Popillia japonica TaxID=7064 RepID=A0AAW1MCC4_POPJA